MSFETIWVKVRADMLDFNRKMAGMQSTMQKVGSKMKAAGTSMTLGLTAPIALFGVATLKAAGNFEAGMNKVQAVSGATAKEFEKLRNQAKLLGATTQFSATEAADAMGFLAMAGLEVDEIYAAMPNTLNLAAAAQLDMGSAADIVTNVLTGMQVPLEELPHAVDVLAKAFTSSNTDLQQLGQGMKFVGPVAGAFGVGIETTTAALGLLSNAGMQAGLAGTGFRKVLSKLVSQEKKLGVQTKDSAGKLLPLADIIDSLTEKGFGGAEALKIFGDRGGPAMINLLSAGGEEIRRFTALLDDSGGTAERIAKVQMKGLNGAMKQLKSAFEAFQIALSESGLMEWVGNMAKSMANFFRSLTNVNPAILRMATAVLAVVAAIGPLALIMGTVITAAGAMLGPIALVVAALAALAAGAAYFALQNDKASESLQKEKLGLNSLVGAITNANNTEETRLQLIQEMKEEYPNFLKDIDEEKMTTEFLTKALQDMNKEYDKKIMNALKEEETDKLRTERIKKQIQELDLIKDIADAEAKGNHIRKTNATVGAMGIDQTYESYQRLGRALELNRSEQADLSEEIQKTIDKYDSLIGVQKEIGKSEPSGGKGGGSGAKTLVDENTKKKASMTNYYHALKQMRNEHIAQQKVHEDLSQEQLEEYLLKRSEAKDKELEAEKLREEKRKDIFIQMTDAVSLAMGAMGSVLAKGLTESAKGFDRFLGFMVQTVTKLLAMMMAASIGAAIEAGSISALGTGLGAVFAAPAFIATAVGGVMAAFAAIPAFAKGGIVGSPMMAMVGDNVNARHDPEVISPLSKLKGMMGGGQGNQLFAVVYGEDIYLSQQEYMRKNINTNG